MKIGFFPMVGDLLHVGHLKALEYASQNCDYLIAGLNCNPGKGDTVETVYERFTRLQACKWVDEIIPYQDDNDLIDNVLPTLEFQIYFCGDDHWGNLKQEALLKETGKEISWVPRNHGMSSSSLKERICGKLQN